MRVRREQHTVTIDGKKLFAHSLRVKPLYREGQYVGASKVSIYYDPIDGDGLLARDLICRLSKKRASDIEINGYPCKVRLIKHNGDKFVLELVGPI